VDFFPTRAIFLITPHPEFLISSILVGAASGTTSCPHLGFGSTRIAVRAICRLNSASAPTSPVKLWRSLTEKGTETALGAYTAVIMGPGANIHIPPEAPSSPGPLYSDFFQQQIAKQRNNNYHSTSLRNMVATSVNRTALHPGGVQYASPCSCPLCLAASTLPFCRTITCLPYTSMTYTNLTV
jgi:hypothetical protein